MVRKIFFLIISILCTYIHSASAIEPRLSIIVSLCKQRTLIAGLIDDLTKQTIFPQCELLLIGSKEYNLATDIAPYLHKYENIRFICMKGSFDEIDLINFAIEQAKAPFLVKVHAGDTHLPHAFQKRVVALESDQSIDVIYNDYWWSYEPHKQAMQCKQNDISILPEFNPLLFCVALPGPEPMWRKSIHQRFGYFEKEFIHKYEWAFWKKISTKNANFKKMLLPDMVHFINFTESKKPDFSQKVTAILDEEQSIINMYSMNYDKNSVQKPMVIIIPSYNNAVWYKRNLDSIFMQHYENYRIIYVNDASRDETDSLVQNYIVLNHQTHRVTYINNPERKGCPLANIWYALSLCKPEEIAMILDGDDWFANENVLAFINDVYKDQDVWLTYGQFAVFPFEFSGWVYKVPQEVIEKNKIRQYHWVTTHLRTFYVHLFSHIKIEDLMIDDRFFPMAGDLAFMFPLVELAGFHSRFIPEILYIYNRANALNEDKVNKALQSECEKAARNGTVYKPL